MEVGGPETSPSRVGPGGRRGGSDLLGGDGIRRNAHEESPRGPTGSETYGGRET